MTISTAIPSPEYQPLLDAIGTAKEICDAPPAEERVPGASGFAIVALSRWAANCQAFILLRNASMLTDAYGVARMGSELAIITAWAWFGGAAVAKFPTPADRVRALIQDGSASTRAWFDNMKALGATVRGYDETTNWGRVLMSATRPGLPPLEQMAAPLDVTRQLYTFAYRGESGSVHSAARVLASHAAGAPPLPEPLMLQNVLAAALVTFGAVANLLEDDRARRTATELQQALRDRAPKK